MRFRSQDAALDSNGNFEESLRQGVQPKINCKRVSAAFQITILVAHCHTRGHAYRHLLTAMAGCPHYGGLASAGRPQRQKEAAGGPPAKKETATLLKKCRLLWALIWARKTDPENVDNEMLRRVGAWAPKLRLRQNLFRTPLTRQSNNDSCLQPWSFKSFGERSF